jgi:hypothetical protein
MKHPRIPIVAVAMVLIPILPGQVYSAPSIELAQSSSDMRIQGVQPVAPVAPHTRQIGPAVRPFGYRDDDSPTKAPDLDRRSTGLPPGGFEPSPPPPEMYGRGENDLGWDGAPYSSRGGGYGR